MKSESEVEISAEGIFVSCSQGQTRVWEFHPNDVISVGAYLINGRLHEVIVTLNRDFDISEATSGLKELNERLSRELKANLTLDGERFSSPRGVVLWPYHLAGSPLWEFYIIGKDGLANYVSADTPHALRNLCRAVCREMARFSKPHLPEGFPQPLIDGGFIYHGAIGWRRDDALTAAEWLRGRGAAIVDAELWLVKNAAVQPHIRTTSGLHAYHHWTTTHASETWESFATRSLSETASFISQFRWPDAATERDERDVRFCLSWVWREWLEEDEFRFPD